MNMKVQQLIEGVYMLPLGTVNAYLLQAEDGLILD